MALARLSKLDRKELTSALETLRAALEHYNDRAHQANDALHVAWNTPGYAALEAQETTAMEEARCDYNHNAEHAQGLVEAHAEELSEWWGEHSERWQEGDVGAMWGEAVDAWQSCELPELDPFCFGDDATAEGEAEGPRYFDQADGYACDELETLLDGGRVMARERNARFEILLYTAHAVCLAQESVYGTEAHAQDCARRYLREYRRATVAQIHRGTEPGGFEHTPCATLYRA